MRDESLLRRLQKRYSDHDTANYNIMDFVGAFGSPFEALMYSRLFWPEFIEINGMVFLKETIEDNDDRDRLDEALKHYDGDKTKTEQSFNLIEIPSGIFGSKLAYETTDEEDLALAERLAEMWQHRLQMIYPDRKFTVQILSAEETGGEVGVIFYTERA